jgi:hypothetical protein
MTNYRDKFLANETVKVNTKNISRKEETYLKEELSKVSDSSMANIEKEIESTNFIFNFNKLAKIIRPSISHKDPSTFAFYGSAEIYYKDAFDAVTNRYPYDGSRNERISWAITASAIDVSILQHAYPKSTGHIIFSPSGKGSQVSVTGKYQLTDKIEYLSFTGGPQVKSNFNETTRAGSNLAIDPTHGNTAEFWLKKKNFGDSFKEVILDVHTLSSASGSVGYGRILIEMDPTSAAQPFTFSYISASSGFINQKIGSSFTTSSVADDSWHHYALSVGNHSGSLRARLYVDGALNHTITTAGTLGVVTTSTTGSLGSLAAKNHALGGVGWGKLSGSLDEFRFWRSERNPKQIGVFYDRSVYGGTLKDSSNPDLGIYFKFNEGITKSSLIDSVVLDYSGRINNASFVGYSSLNRSLESAITLSTVTKQTEEKDPIIRPEHPEVIEKKKDYMLLGEGYDRENHSALRKSLPQWVYDEDVFGASKDDSEMAILIQAISNEFDTIKALIDNVLKINSKEAQDYFTATSNVEYDNKHLFGCAEEFEIDSSGRRDSSKLSDFSLAKDSFIVEKYPLLDQSGYLEHFYSMSENQVFEQETQETRNKILKNVHKNLVHIYKTKGTEASFRNMIRCFGADENLIRLNVYAQNQEREIKNDPIYIAPGKKSIAFENNTNVTIYQSSSAADLYSRNSVSPSGLAGYTPWTVEGCFVFPDNSNLATSYGEANIFGATSSLGNSFSFDVTSQKYSSRKKQSYFKVTSPANLFTEMTSSYFPEVYNNTKWNLGFRVSRDSDMTLSTVDIAPYKAEFFGYEYDLDVLRNSFHVSSSITEAQFRKWSTEDKVFFAGAKRSMANYMVSGPGTVLKNSDCRIVSLSVWADALMDSEIKEHALNPHNIGRLNPQNVSSHDLGTNIYSRQTHVLDWRFEDVTSTNSDSKIVVTDYSSGSAANIRAFGGVVGHQYPATSTAFTNTSSAVIQEFFPSVEYMTIDNAYSSDLVKIKEDEFEKFEIDSRPTTYAFSFEKSMYQVISKDMLNFVAGVTAFNNLLGEPVNKYRKEYKALQKLNDRFFSRSPTGPNLDNFIECYKWIDSSLAEFLNKISPANSRISSHLKNVVESHSLERSKYEHKFPTVEFKNPNVPITPFLGVNELLYDWEHGHWPQIASDATAASLNEIVHLQSTPVGARLIISVPEDASIDGLDKIVYVKVVSNPASPPEGYIYVKTDASMNTIAARMRSAINQDPSSKGVNWDWHAAVDMADNLVASGDSNSSFIDLNLKKSGTAGNDAFVNTTQNSGSYWISSTNNNGDQNTGQYFSGGRFFEQSNNCLWWKDRAERDASLSVDTKIDSNRETLRKIYNKETEGSTYVLRKLTKPYKYSVDRQDFLVHGSNRKANKIKDFYKFINSGKDITLNINDIYEFRKCDDNINPQRERIYATKADTEGTGGYLDADGDMLFPFTLYSSSAGVDFSNFKENIVITNNHDDLESSWAQSPFVFSHNSGMPHRRVPFGTADADRPEAYDIVTTSTELRIKATTQKPKSMIRRETSGGHLLNISNIKSVTGSLLLGNYTKDYEIVMTNSRHSNNNYFVDTEGAFLSSPGAASTATFVGTPALNGADGTNLILRNTDGSTVTFHTDPTKNFGDTSSDGGDHTWIINTRDISGGSEIRKATQAFHIACLAAIAAGELNMTAVPATNTGAQTSFTLTQTTAGTPGNTAITLITGVTASGKTSFTGGTMVFAATSAPSKYIFSGSGFKVPDRGRSGHVIVNRFAAPGAKDSMGPKGMDRVSEEYSIYNTVNYRNSIVRDAWNVLSKEYSSLHGYLTSSTTQASVHMTPRNPARFTGSLGDEVDYDNFFVQHPIPQNDFGYSWITASVQGDVYDFLNKNANHGHQHLFNIPGTLESSQTITFMTSSEGGAYRHSDGNHRFGVMKQEYLTAASQRASFLPVDFSGMNSVIFEPVSASSNILGFPSLIAADTGNDGVPLVEVNYINQAIIPGEADGEETFTIPDAGGTQLGGVHSILNALILHRQGPYGWPSWKQIRGGDHPIMRRHRKDNTFSILMRGDQYNVSAISDYQYDDHPANQTIRDLTINDARVIINYKDPPVTSHFNAIVMTKHRLLESTDTGEYEKQSLIKGPHFSNQFKEQALWHGDEYYYGLNSQGDDKTLSLSEARAFNPDIYKGTISMAMTLPNDVTTYANRQIIKDFEIDEMLSAKKENFLTALSVWMPSAESQTPGTQNGPIELREINYIETLYPKENNTYTKNARTRENFVFHGWNSSRGVREAFLSGNVGYTGAGTFTGHTRLTAFPQIAITNDKDFSKSHMGRIDLVNMASTGSMSYGSPITSSTWPLDARKDFTSLPVGIDLSFNTGKEVFLSNNEMGTKGEGLLQNDYGIFAMGYNGLYGTPPISMTYNRRIPQEVILHQEFFESATVGQNPTGWTPNGTLSDYNVRALSSSAGNKILAFTGTDTGNQRTVELSTVFTGAALIRFDLMAAGGQLGTDFGFPATGGSQSDQTPDPSTGAFHLQYELQDSLHTWYYLTSGNSIVYESGMQTNFKTIEIMVPVAPTAQWKVRFVNTNNAGDDHNKWGIDNFKVIKNVLAGEAKFQTADAKMGPFYDSYEEYNDEIRRVAQDHSIVPEFRMSDFVEEYYNPSSPRDTSRMRNEFLSLTGAVYHTSSGELQVGSQFFKTYGSSEFMKYFGSLEETLKSNDRDFSPTRLTLKCQAAMKFLPYKGFFPAERVQQIGEVFARTYMKSGSHSFDIDVNNATSLSTDQKTYLLDRRIEASKQQVMKPFFGPGILNNSIKAGLAVDWPLFDTNFEATLSDIESVTGNNSWDASQAAFVTGAVGSVAATGKIYFYPARGMTVDDTITLTDTAGTARVYTVKNSGNLSNRHFSSSASGTGSLLALKQCIEHASGHGGSITVSNPVTVFWGIQSMDVTQTVAGAAGNVTMASSMTAQEGNVPMTHVGFSAGAGGAVVTGITGSLVNSSFDSGIPRLKGTVSRRLDFDDMLYIEDLYEQTIPDNEPHPSASLFYGNALWNKVIERPPVFGSLNHANTLEYVGVDFVNNKIKFTDTLAPFKSAIHNFTAETVSFFLEGQKLETLMSDPVKFKYVDLENEFTKEYKMRVYLQNADITMYDRHSAFGPPVDDGAHPMKFYETGSAEGITRTVSHMHGFMPYVPPYLDRNASPYVEYTFIPRENKTYNAIDIIDQLTASYVNFHKVPAAYASSANYKHAMSITASLDLTQIFKLSRDQGFRDQDGNILDEATDYADFGWRWGMQPKWETPVHDFKNAAVDALRTDNNTVESVTNSPWKVRKWQTYYDELGTPSSIPYLTASTGMWHQLGTNLRNEVDGYYLRIEDVGENGLATAVGFLNPDDSHAPADLLAESTPPQQTAISKTSKLGKIASKKQIKEAVVAIPYYLDDSCNLNFFDIDQGHYETAVEHNGNLAKSAMRATINERSVASARKYIERFEKESSTTGTTAEANIAYQLRMMDRYIVPPVFDFRSTREEAMNPFVIYFFEFNAELDQTDLSNIWQNIYPESSESTASPRYSRLWSGDPSRSDVVYSSHILDSAVVNKLHGGETQNHSNYNSPETFIKNEVRWMVFKCKYRAEKDYSVVQDISIDPAKFFETKPGTSSEQTSITRLASRGRTNTPVSFNWPYDYFSFVELIKLESKVDFYSIGVGPEPRRPRGRRPRRRRR